MESKNITETVGYEDLLMRVKFEKECNYLKENQGKTFENIVDYLGEKDNEKGMKFLVDIWVSHWNTFFHSGGRIVKNNNTYFCLSPKNPKSRERNPIVQSYIN
jgi:hypothetical protein